jgi:uncharacterized membrane protein YfcA
LAGGLLGSLLLVWLPSKTFAALVPWLILTAALLFALQPTISRWVGIGTPHSDLAPSPPRHSPALFAGMLGFQFLVAVYGGYFGAGIGILMLSALALMGLEDIHQMNAVKTLLNLVINGTSVMVFVASGLVEWRFAIAMAASSIVGGYLAARTVRQVNKRLVRLVIVGIGFALAGYYFYRELMA